MPSKTQPTASEVAAHMWTVLERVMAGDMTPASANASINAGSAIVRTFVSQMQYAKLRNETPDIAFFSGPSRP